MCSVAGDNAFLFYPAIPDDAVRVGRLVPAESTLRVTLTDPSSGELLTIPDIVPETGMVTIQVGDCGPPSTECDFTIRQIDMAFPEVIALGELFLLNGGLRFSGMPRDPSEGRVTVRPSAPDAWSLITARHIPLELRAMLANTRNGSGELNSPIAFGAEWGFRETGDDRPHGDFSVRRRSDKLIEFLGTIRAMMPIEGSLPAPVTLEVAVTYRFYAGAPNPEMRVTASPLISEPSSPALGQTEYLLLDGSDTWDELGGEPVSYVWEVRSRGAQRVIAEGARAQISRGDFEALLGSDASLCLTVADADGNRDTRCRAPSLDTPSDGDGPPTCREVGLSSPLVSRYRALVRRSGLDKALDQLSDVTFVALTDEALDELFPLGGHGELDPARAREIVGRAQRTSGRDALSGARRLG